MTETEGLETLSNNIYVDLDAAGEDKGNYGELTKEDCEAKSKELGAPAFVMDYRGRNNGKGGCWIKNDKISGKTMSVIPGVTTYNMKNVPLYCPTIPASEPKSKPITEDIKGGNYNSIVLSDWDVNGILTFHNNIVGTDGKSKFTLSNTDDMRQFIGDLIVDGVSYSSASSAVTNEKTLPVNGQCVGQMKKYTFLGNNADTYTKKIKEYIDKSNITSYKKFKQVKSANDKIGPTGNGFTTLFESFVEGLAISVTPNITNNIMLCATNNNFTIVNDASFVQFANFIDVHSRVGNSSCNYALSKLKKWGINSSKEFFDLLYLMENKIGFVISENAMWIIDTLPAYGIVDKTTMQTFKNDMNADVYKNFGFVTPKDTSLEKHGPEVYFWYLYELTKIGVGVNEFAGFSSAHSTIFASYPEQKANMATTYNEKSTSWAVASIFPEDKFLQLIPIYVKMGFNYRSAGGDQINNKTNYESFCGTVRKLAPVKLPDKLNLFCDYMRRYNMKSFMEYITFTKYLTETVGLTTDLVDTMNKIQVYIDNKSGIKFGNTYATGTVEIADEKDATKMVAVPIFDYNKAKEFIGNYLMANDNKYGVTGNQVLDSTGKMNSVNFTNYVTNLNTQNWQYGNTMVPTINSGAKYVESEVRSNTMANKTYSSIKYDAATDPALMSKEGFGGLNGGGDWIDAIGNKVSEWIVSLFKNEKEGLTDNTKSDHQTLTDFGINNADEQLPAVIAEFKKYGVTDFNEMIYLISCLNRIGVSLTDMVSLIPGFKSCLQILKDYKIDKTRIDVFTQHMKNAGLTTWVDVAEFINKTSNFGVNKDAINYKQFIYMARKFGCNFSIQYDRINLYMCIRTMLDFGIPGYNVPIAQDQKFTKSESLTNNQNVKNGNEQGKMWEKYVGDYLYKKPDANAEKTQQSEGVSPYQCYAFDNFVENMLAREYTVQNWYIIATNIMSQMWYVKDKSANKFMFEDLFNYVNATNLQKEDFLPIDNNGNKIIEIYMSEILDKMLNALNANLRKNIQIEFLEYNEKIMKKYSDNKPKAAKYIVRYLLEMNMKYMIEPLANYDCPIKVADMISYVTTDEFDAILGNNSAVYDILFGTTDKIIEYMMDMAIGMKMQMKGIESKPKPIDSTKYNNILSTAYMIVNYPIFMFRWMEQQIKENNKSDLCSSQNTTNRSACYRNITLSANSSDTYRRASFVPPKL